MEKAGKNKLTSSQQLELLFKLKERFENDSNRLNGIEWKKVEDKLNANPGKLWSLHEMETTGGEPALIELNKKTNALIFTDCSAESPKGRRSLCYDRTALESRKENKPSNNAMDMALKMGIEILNEAQYRNLQQIRKFDLKTSSWILTTADIRNLGGALFCDRRYDTVFTYHNGAESYYAARGFRGRLIV